MCAACAAKAHCVGFGGKGRDVLPSFCGRERAPCCITIGDEGGSEGELSHVVEGLDMG